MSATHDVFNQVPPLTGFDAYAADAVLREAVERGEGGWAAAELHGLGAWASLPETQEAARLANVHPPVLTTHDRYGNRIDEVVFHPAYHQLLGHAVAKGLHSLPFEAPRPGAHVARCALNFVFHFAEAGVLCPSTMTFASMPALRQSPELAAVWESRILSRAYDPELKPSGRKTGAMIGMAMTEKQGGSDVRANTTRAVRGAGDDYRLTGHKWFCSAPMSDGFLTLAQAEGGLTCFFVPRFLPDGTRNAFLIQRLKDKLGNKSNASAEIEYHDTHAVRIGEEGRGVPAIIEMVHHTRLDTAVSAAAFMRVAVARATHHAAHRSAFQKTLIDQPVMRRVLADMAVESEAATALSLRVAEAFDRGEDSLARIAVAAAKFWLCKRVTGLVAEALEVHGGNGYVEDFEMARLFRDAPLNGIWEGTGNVMALDVLRAAARERESVDAAMAELKPVRGADRRLDAHIAATETLLAAPHETDARRTAMSLALALQGALLVRHGPDFVADAFCASRFGGDGLAYGLLPDRLDEERIVARARPEVE